MQATRLTDKLLKEVTTDIHATRRQALQCAVETAMNGQVLTVTGLGRAVDNEVSTKHNIKRMDRLLSNGHLQQERVGIYQQLTHWLIGPSQRTVIVVDWSDLNPEQTLFLLRASVAIEGRSLTLYEQVHGLDSKDKPATHKAFLRQLKSLLPDDCSPIVVTDAGFRVPWFKLVAACGWAWIGRIRNQPLIRFADDDEADWHSAKELHKQASGQAKVLGEITLTKSNPLKCRLIAYKRKAKGRVQTNRQGQRSRAHHSHKQAARGREPWLLVTSLPMSSTLAKRVVKIYRHRMQIEESFRDVKSHRYGLSLNDSLTRDRQRMQILLLIGALAMVVAWWLGKATELVGQHYQFQSNSVKHKVVLSTVFIGFQVVGDAQVRLFAIDFDNAKRALLDLIQSAYEL